MAGLLAVKYFMLKEAATIMAVSKANMNVVWLGAIALGVFVLELIFVACPRLKRAYRQPKGKKAAAQAAEEEACANGACGAYGAQQSAEQVPVQLFTQPGVITQGGVQYMVMPMNLGESEFVAPPVEPTFEYYFVDGQEEN
jgi:hypothetical protein